MKFGYTFSRKKLLASTKCNKTIIQHENPPNFSNELYKMTKMVK